LGYVVKLSEKLIGYHLRSENREETTTLFSTWQKWKGFTPARREKLRQTALRNKPWLKSTGHLHSDFPPAIIPYLKKKAGLARQAASPT